MLYVALSNVETFLDGCLYYNEIGEQNQALTELGFAITGLARADWLLRSVDKGLYQRYDNYDSNSPSLLSIYVLVYQAIMKDEILSDSDIIFLTRLKDDISIAVKQLSENPDVFGYNKNLSLNEIENILDEFSRKWGDNAEDNPWLLIAPTE